MNPTPGDVHVNTPLTNISVACIQSASNFIATQVFPVIPVDKQADRYYVYDRGDFNRDEAASRAPGTESAGGSYKLDNTPTYFADVVAFHKDIPDQVRANSDSSLDPDREATIFVTNKALIRREKVFVANYFTTGKWGKDITGVASGPTGDQVLRWSDVNSDPIKDIKAGKRFILGSTGIESNTLVLSQDVYDILTEHPDITDRVKYGQTAGAPATANIDALKKLLELDRIFVMKAVENTAAEGATASHSFIASKGAMLCHAAPAPGLMTPSAGYTFNWKGYVGATNEGNRIKRFRMENLSSDRVEIEIAFDLKLVAADLGIFWNSIIE